MSNDGSISEEEIWVILHMLLGSVSLLAQAAQQTPAEGSTALLLPGVL